MALWEGALEKVLKAKPEVCEIAEEGRKANAEKLFQEEIKQGIFAKSVKFGEAFSDAVKKLEKEDGKTELNVFSEKALFNREKIYQCFEEAVKVAKAGKTAIIHIYSEKNEQKEKSRVRIRPDDVKNSQNHPRLLKKYIETIKKICEATDPQILEEKRQKALSEFSFNHNSYHM
jgi:L-cysteine desulfidase